MTDTPTPDTNRKAPDPNAAGGEPAGQSRPDQGRATPPGKADAVPATGGDGAQGAGGPAGFGT
jgi:hypothetical protein